MLLLLMVFLIGCSRASIGDYCPDIFYFSQESQIAIKATHSAALLQDLNQLARQQCKVKYACYPDMYESDCDWVGKT